jgi:hypothetical protein
MRIMMKHFSMGEQPTTMTVFAQAVWNPIEGYWEVSLISSETNTTQPSGRYSFMQTSHTIKVADCDEFVIADALLHANGINVQTLYNATENPIVKQE